MSYKPPFARMRAIKAKHRTNRSDPTPVAPPPASVDEALEALAAEVKPEPSAPVVEPKAKKPKVKEPKVKKPKVKDEVAPEPVDAGDPAVAPNMDMKRSELNALAKAAGVHPSKLANKQAVIDAITNAQGG
jgi:hypothetical protein